MDNRDHDGEHGGPHWINGDTITQASPHQIHRAKVRREMNGLWVYGLEAYLQFLGLRRGQELMAMGSWDVGLRVRGEPRDRGSLDQYLAGRGLFALDPLPGSWPLSPLCIRVFSVCTFFLADDLHRS